MNNKKTFEIEMTEDEYNYFKAIKQLIEIRKSFPENAFTMDLIEQMDATIERVGEEFISLLNK